MVPQSSSIRCSVVWSIKDQLFVSSPVIQVLEKPGHIKAECPKLKKDGHKKKDNFRRFKKYKKKAMAAAWENSSDSDSESSSSSDEEEANLAFMANIDDKERFTFVKTKLCGNKAVDVADLEKNRMHSIVDAMDSMKWTGIATLSEIWDTKSKLNVSLPYAHLLTKVFSHFGVNLSGAVVEKMGQAIRSRNLIKSGFSVVNGVWTETSVAEGEAIIGEAQDAQQEAAADLVEPAAPSGIAAAEEPA
ncbi:hypothetical protein Taro_021280 [Colocasia esculenta]|uniref:Uncharacterized protein n=1 Tax=Colocasia esculenta TaxID=4460 RepID=A0A843UYL5_COLES|nr:hypothetical protein [Colocasia esculenta]